MRTAVIGLGVMGRRHVQNVLAMGLPLVGISDAKTEALDKAGSEHGIPPEKRFNDTRAMLQSAKPDCVIVTTTAPGHAPLTSLAATNGVKAVLCEKPLAVSLSECDSLVSLCRSKGVRLAVNHQMRFMEQYRKVQEIIASDEIGRLASVSVVAGNFGLAMNGTHYFELFRWLTGESPTSVWAKLSGEKVPNPRGPQFEDAGGTVRVENPSGRRMILEIGTDQGHGVRLTYAGRHGFIHTDELAGTIEVVSRLPEHRALPTTRYGMPASRRVIEVSPADSLAPSRAVLEALIQGKDIPTGEDGRSAVAAVVAAHVSNEKGSVPVLIDGALPLERRFPFA